MKSIHQLARRQALTGLAMPRVLSTQNLAASRTWQRAFSASAPAASQLPDLDPSKLTITKTTTPKEPMDSKDLVFGKYFTGKQDMKLCSFASAH
jgi:branched-chain amino acid aminotransferase